MTVRDSSSYAAPGQRSTATDLRMTSHVAITRARSRATLGEAFEKESHGATSFDASRSTTRDRNERRERSEAKGAPASAPRSVVRGSRRGDAKAQGSWTRARAR